MMTLQNVLLCLTLYKSDQETVDHVAVDNGQYKTACRLSLAAFNFSVISLQKICSETGAGDLGDFPHLAKEPPFSVSLRRLEKIYEEISANFEKHSLMGRKCATKLTSKYYMNRQRQKITDRETAQWILE